MRTEQLHEDMQLAVKSYESEKELAGRYSQVLAGGREALVRLREIINNSRFIAPVKPLEELKIADVLPYYSQMTYQMLSLNSKFTTMSETEISQRFRLRTLANELEALKASSSIASQLTEAINLKWTGLGHEPLVLESHFKYALSELASEPKIDLNIRRNEEFLCVIHLSGNEVARRVLGLLSQIEKLTHPLPPSIATTMSSLASLIKPPGQKVTIFPLTPEVKKYRGSLTRKGSFQTPLRSPLSLTPGLHFSRAVTTEESEVTESAVELVTMGLGQEILREVLVEEHREDENTREAVFSSFMEIQTVRLFVDKIRFREVLQAGREGETPQASLLGLILELISDSHAICMDKFQKRTDLLRTCLLSLTTATHNTEKQLSDQQSLLDLPKQRNTPLPLSDIPKPSAPLFDSKGKSTPFPSFHRNNQLLSDTHQDGIFSGTEVDEAEEEGLQAERDFFKTRGASLVPGLQKRSRRSQSTDALNRKTTTLMTRKGSDFEKGLLEQNQAIALRIKKLVDCGAFHTDRERLPQRKTEKRGLPQLFKKYGTAPNTSRGKRWS
jgi:hypothetical protein